MTTTYRERAAMPDYNPESLFGLAIRLDAAQKRAGKDGQAPFIVTCKRSDAMVLSHGDTVNLGAATRALAEEIASAARKDGYLTWITVRSTGPGLPAKVAPLKPCVFEGTSLDVMGY